MRDTRGVLTRKTYRLSTESSSSMAPARFSADLKTLEVQGFIIGHVSGKLEERPPIIEIPFFMQLIRLVMHPMLAYLIFKLIGFAVDLASWPFHTKEKIQLQSFLIK